MDDFKAISEGLQRIVAAQARKIEILEAEKTNLQDYKETLISTVKKIGYTEEIAKKAELETGSKKVSDGIAWMFQELKQKSDTLNFFYENLFCNSRNMTKQESEKGWQPRAFCHDPAMKTATELLQLANDLKRFLDLSDKLRVLHQTSVRGEWESVEEEVQQACAGSRSPHRYGR